jgi:hypothetical protein
MDSEAELVSATGQSNSTSLRDRADSLENRANAGTGQSHSVHFAALRDRGDSPVGRREVRVHRDHDQSSVAQSEMI